MASPTTLVAFVIPRVADRERGPTLFEAEAPEQAAVLAAPKLYPGVTPTHKGADNGISSLPNTHHRSSIVADRTAG